jgi:hypothetical protein
VKRNSDSIEFTHTLDEPSIDFGYVYTKTIRLTKGKPQMTIEHVLKNTGRKPIVTNVYDHNFTTIDNQPPGPDYEISFPFQLQRPQRGAPPRAATNGSRCGQPEMQSLAAPDANRLVYTKALAGVECFQTTFTGFGATAADHEIRNRK